MKLSLIITLLLQLSSIFLFVITKDKGDYYHRKSLNNIYETILDSIYIKFDKNVPSDNVLLAFSIKKRQLFVEPDTNYRAYYFDDFSTLIYRYAPTDIIYPIKSGDSLFISLKNNLPYIEVINNKKYTEREVNFVTELSIKNLNIIEYIYESKRNTSPEKAYNASLKYADSLFNIGELSQTFVSWFKKEAEFSYLRLPEFEDIKIAPFDASEKLNIDSNLHIYFYRRLLWKRMDNLLNKDYSIERVIQTAQKNFTGASRDYVLLEFAVQNLSKKNAKEGKSVINQLEGHFSDNNFITLLKTQYLPKYDADLSMTDQLLKPDGTTTSFDKMILKNKGKKIYIDVWASWCVPCREEMPHSHRLKKDLNSETVVFVYLSIDKKHNDWLKANQEEALGEDNSYLIVNLDESDFLKKFQINAIPRYFVIDENGKIINEKAPRPSSSEIEILLRM